MNNSQTFEEKGGVKIENFIDPQTIAVVSRYFENKIRRGDWKEANEGPQAASKYFYYADPLIEVLLESSLEAVQEVVGKELIPTYSYSRIYQPGEKLAPHLDRPACEISVTINVATKGSFSPIYMQYADNDPQEYTLNPGDAVIYKGCEATHWRKTLKNDQLNVQFMLHYVSKNGPYAEYAKDKRPAYGTPPPKK
jgi:hypothetical protein